MSPTFRPSNRSICAAFAAVAVIGAVGSQADAGRRAKSRPAAERCPAAGRAAITVPDGVDAILVFVDRANPDDATDVTVLSGDSDRTVRAFGEGVFGLALDEPLTGSHIEVALEPVLDAPGAACVSRIELLRSGAVVGTAQIK